MTLIFVFCTPHKMPLVQLLSCSAPFSLQLFQTFSTSRCSLDLAAAEVGCCGISRLFTVSPVTCSSAKCCYFLFYCVVVQQLFSNFPAKFILVLARLNTVATFSTVTLPTGSFRVVLTNPSWIVLQLTMAVFTIFFLSKSFLFTTFHQA